MIKTHRIAMSALCFGALLAPSMFGDTIQNQTGLASPAFTVTFDDITFAQGTLITNQYASEGVTFSNLVYDGQAPSTCCNGIDNNLLANFDQSGVNPLVNPFTITFTTVQNSAAFAIATNAATTTFTAFLGGTQVDTFTSPTSFDSSTPFFFGFTGENFDSIQITVGGDQGALIDNIQLGTAATPEPSTLLLVGGSLGAVILRRRRAAK